MRALAGQDAALRVVCVDPDSRVPERRVVLTPFPELSDAGAEPAPARARALRRTACRRR